LAHGFLPQFLFLVLVRRQFLRRFLFVLRRQLLRSELEGELVDRAVESEWYFVAVVHCRARIDPDIERFIDRHQERNGVLDGLARQFLTIDREHTRAALARPGAVVLEIEYDLVLARLERGAQPVLRAHAALPAEALQIEQVVHEHRLAFEQVETIAAEAPTQGHDHALRALLGNRDIRGYGVVLVQNARRIAEWNAGVFTRVSEHRAPRARARSRRQESREARKIQWTHVIFGRFGHEQGRH